MNEGLSLAWSRVTVERQYSASLAAHGATAIVLAQEAFADAQTLGGYFDQFVIVDEFDSTLQRQLNRRHKTYRFIGS